MLSSTGGAVDPVELSSSELLLLPSFSDISRDRATSVDCWLLVDLTERVSIVDESLPPLISSTDTNGGDDFSSVEEGGEDRSLFVLLPVNGLLRGLILIVLGLDSTCLFFQHLTQMSSCVSTFQMDGKT